MSDTPEFRKWKSINKFSDAYAKAQKFQTRKFKFRGKIKLHGTNAGIQFNNTGEHYPMKRSGFIDMYHDNCGFANAVTLMSMASPANNIIVYGEWAGPGVQKTDAVCQIGSKAFFVFSVLDIDNDVMIYEPEEIQPIVAEIWDKDHEDQNVYILPWHTEEYEIDFTRQGECQRFIDSVMKEVDEKISVCDPYIKETFGVEGPGEGLVMYGVAGQKFDNTALETDAVFDYIFKAKTEAHSVQKEKNRNHVAPEKPDGIEDFIDMFFTEVRFEQMLNQIGGQAEAKLTGTFLKAVMSDVYKESEQEVLLANFEWKDVPKYAAPVVKTWWFDQCNKL